MAMSLYPARAIDGEATRMARFLPSGRIWNGFRTAGKVARLLLRGLAKENIRIYDAINLLLDIMPDTTVLFLDEWERALGLPDECLYGAPTDAIRRRNILIKLAAMGVQSSEDFVALGALFGFVIEVNSGIDHDLYATVLPAISFGSDKEARNTIVVKVPIADDLKFPLDFPIPFFSSDKDAMECLFRKLKPATSHLLIVLT